jgi:GNAT superfamily N-acetyltransferase
MGITVESWSEDTRSGALVGYICVCETTIAGYCFGSPATSEVVVLALLPAFERQGIGRKLLGRVVQDLRRAGHRRLFLGCPLIRRDARMVSTGISAGARLEPWTPREMKFLSTSVRCNPPIEA